MNFSTEEELKELKGYHDYIMKWNQKIGEFLKVWLEPENELNKVAVAVKKCDVMVGSLSKGKPGRFGKTNSFFLRGSNENSCKVEVTGKRVNFGDEEGLQIPCNLHFSGDVNYLDKLKYILPTT